MRHDLQLGGTPAPWGVPAGAGVACDDDVRQERARIVYARLAEVETLAARAALGICAAIPAYQAQKPELLADLSDQLVKNYRANLTLFLEGGPLTLEDLSFVRGAAMRRARAGIALEDYLNAYRVGQQMLWEAIAADAISTPVGQAAALSLATELISYTNFASTHAGRAYVEFQQFAIADADRQGRDLLEHLLAGAMPTRGSLVSAAHAYGIRGRSEMLVSSAVPAAGESAPDALSGAGLRTAQAALAGSGMLVVLRQSEIVVVQVLGESLDAVAFAERVESLQERLRLDEGVTLAIGVSTVAVGVPELPRAYLEARSAVELLSGDGGVVALPRMSSLDYLSLRADDTARRLIDPAIRQFLTEDRARGGVLVETIRALAGADLNMRVAAQRLFVHPNTAHYRLCRVEERTGRNPRRLADLFELLVAIRLDELDAAPSDD